MKNKSMLFKRSVFSMRNPSWYAGSAPLCQSCHKGYGIWKDLIGGRHVTVTCNHCGFAVTGVSDSTGDMSSREGEATIMLRMKLMPKLRPKKHMHETARLIHEHIKTGEVPKRWRDIICEMSRQGWLPAGVRYPDFTQACESVIRCHEQRCNLLTMLAAISDNESRREENRLNRSLQRVKHKRQQLEWIQERCPWRLPGRIEDEQ